MSYALAELDNSVATKADVKEIMLYIKGILAALTLGLGWMAWMSIKLIAIAEKIL